MTTPSTEDSLPSRTQLQHWIDELTAAVEHEHVDASELVDLLGQLRRLGRDVGWLADIVLLLSREQGANLPALASAWSRTGHSTYVHAPDTRITKLRDQHGSAAGVLEAYHALSLPTGNEDNC